MTYFVCTDATGHPVVTQAPSEIGDVVQAFDTRGPAEDLVTELKAARAANNPEMEARI